MQAKTGVNIREEKSRLLKTIKDSKGRIETELKRYKTALMNLKGAIREYEAHYTRYIAKPNDKLKAKLDVSMANLVNVNSIRLNLLERINGLVELITTSTDALCEIYGRESKEAIKETGNLEKYNANIEKRLLTMDGGITATLPKEVMQYKPPVPAEDETALTEEDEDLETAEPTRASSVNVAPVNIDVTPMVEKAISAAIEEMSRGLNARIEAHIAGMAIALPTTAPVSGTPDTATAELEEHILLGEGALYEKLKAMSVTLDELIAGVAETSGACLTLIQKLNEITQIQKQVNETQRQTARDQQGVSVSQRVIADSQLELITKQKLVSDTSAEITTIIEGIRESQERALESGRAIAESQREIEDAVRELVEREKAILSTEEALQDAASKIENGQRQLLEKQGELLTSQRELTARQRQTERDQRTVAERQAAVESAAPTKRSRKKKAEQTPTEGASEG